MTEIYKTENIIDSLINLNYRTKNPRKFFNAINEIII